MKIRLIIYANYAVAIVAIALACYFSKLGISTFLPIIFPQAAVLAALLKYIHVRNVLNSAGDVLSLKSELDTKYFLFLVFIALFIMIASITYFEFDMTYKVVLIISGDIAMLTLASIFCVLYPVLVKFDAGIYKKITK